MSRKEAPKHARLAILAAGCCILASVIATTAQAPPQPLTPAEIRHATGGATLCENNPFCWGPSYRAPYSTSGSFDPAPPAAIQERKP